VQDEPQLTVDGRFNGPDGSANGGYFCGAFAQLCTGPVAVTLHAPPRLGVPHSVRTGPRRAHLWDGEEVVATAAPTGHRAPDLEPVSVGTARSAGAHYAGRNRHPFPRCFACGTERAPGDGLLLTPGPVPDRADTVACTWTPDDSVTGEDGRVRPEFVWSVLDCPSGWTADIATTPMVLGWMYADLARSPSVGETYAVVARLESAGDHGITAASAVCDSGGAVVASATTRWYPSGTESAD
jgi:hypothetical protein